MEVYNLKDFKRGWIVGNFFPSLFRCNTEVGVQRYKSGDRHKSHYHARGTEINTVVSGLCSFQTYNIISQEEKFQKLELNESLSIPPYTVTTFEAISDCCLVVVKTVSDTNDKYEVDLIGEWKNDLRKIIPDLPFQEIKLKRDLPFADMSNQYVGNWLISSLHKTVRSKGRNFRYWLCICKCGKLTWIRGETLKNKDIKGCTNCNLRLPNFGGSKRYIFRDYKAAAKKRNLEFTLTYEEFIYFLDQNCAYCGTLPGNIFTRNTEIPFNYQGIDRVDNTIGYTKENCLPSCHQCNWSKGAMSKTDFLEWIDKVYNFNVKDASCIGDKYIVGD